MSRQSASRSLAPLLVAVLLAASLPAGAQPARAGTPARPVDLGKWELAERTMVVVGSRKEWERLWNAGFVSAPRTSSGPPRAPRIDFKRHRLAVVTLGMRPNMADAVTIDSTRTLRDTLEIFVHEQVPVSCDVAFAVTHPAATTLVPRRPATVRFRTRRTSGC